MQRAVLDTNEAFYRAIREGDYAGMDMLWAARRPVTCTHPGWTMLSGRDAVMTSWRMLLLEQEPPEIWPGEPRAIVTGATAMVICTEALGGLELMACNAYTLELGEWRLINHQTSRIPAIQRP